MIKMIVKRMIQMIPMLFIISMVSFFLLQLAPGDPIRLYITPSMKPEDVERIRHSLGLDQPIYIQYFRWLTELLHGNLGYSIRSSQPVLAQMLERLPATIGLMGASMVLTLLVAIPLGLATAIRENSWMDKISNLFSYIGISIPSFWLGIILIDFFAIRMQWLPSMGMRTLGVESFVDLIKHSILPIITLSFQSCAIYYRYIRSNTISELKEEYVEFESGKGLSKSEILRNHVLKNVLLPVITLLGMSLPSLITGAFITERIFSWPGMGSYGIDAIYSLDYPIIMAITLFSGLLLIVGNLLADITYYLVDPRIRK